MSLSPTTSTGDARAPKLPPPPPPSPPGAPTHRLPPHRISQFVRRHGTITVDQFNRGLRGAFAALQLSTEEVAVLRQAFSTESGLVQWRNLADEVVARQAALTATPR